MKQLSDYIFHSSWVINDVNIKSYEDYLVLADVGQLKRGDVVTFIGFADVDNHYGIFVFTDPDGKVLEVAGDFCGGNGRAALKAALAKQPEAGSLAT